MREASITRNTTETQITLRLELDGSGKGQIGTGCGFLDHMLTLFTRHGRFDMILSATGDTHVDDHHLTEDVGIVLGQAFRKALGDKKGITRYGDITLPMDEALILAAVDISGRGGYYGVLPIPAQKVGTFDTELCEEFFVAFAREAGLTLHLQKLAGNNSHHIIEGAFKALGRALAKAVEIDPRLGGEIPSTKGVLA
ncbi:MAG: imidazoleglycerol-phosphate dehydratase HisB [Clostridia bacterium]|nr:imidazoleglycerol-phosphate dehydratase HisB [Oscillospiraceae bacterium]MBQ4625339.1 imidazoleglycerol-phosphate dehydratase HisB [Clostridia bacterium]